MKESKGKFLILILWFLSDSVQFRPMMDAFSLLEEQKTRHSPATMHMSLEMELWSNFQTWLTQEKDIASQQLETISSTLLDQDFTIHPKLVKCIQSKTIAGEKSQSWIETDTFQLLSQFSSVISTFSEVMNLQ